MKNLKTLRTFLLASLMALSALSARAAQEEARTRAPMAQGSATSHDATEACTSPLAC